MFDHVARYDEIKLTKAEITIDQRVNKLDAGIRALSDLNSTRGRIDSGDVITECSKPPGDVTVTATEIANRSHAVELLNELNKHARQFLTRRAVARILGVPFKLGVRWRGH